MTFTVVIAKEGLYFGETSVELLFRPLVGEEIVMQEERGVSRWKIDRIVHGPEPETARLEVSHLRGGYPNWAKSRDFKIGEIQIFIQGSPHVANVHHGARGYYFDVNQVLEGGMGGELERFYTSTEHLHERLTELKLSPGELLMRKVSLPLY